MNNIRTEITINIRVYTGRDIRDDMPPKLSREPDAHTLVTLSRTTELIDRSMAHHKGAAAVEHLLNGAAPHLSREISTQLRNP